MPNNLTDYGENQLLVWQLTTTAITRPTAWYLGVGTGNTDITLTGEPSGNGYARQAVSFTVTADTATNSGAITFGPNTTSAWGTMASVAIFDASSGGNCLWAGPLTDAKAIAVGDSLTIAIGALSVTLA
ncbi:MAG: hypothetical protein ACKO0U_07050 [Gammaproteobacteria bacterium]